VLLLLAFLLIAWVIWHQYDSSSVGYQPPVAMPAKQDRTLKPPVSSVQPPDSATNSGIPAGSAAKKQRTPVESFQQAATDSNKPKTVKPKTGPTKVNPKKVKPEPRAADPAVNKTGTVRSEKSDRNKPAEAMRPQPISYWELPDAVRADVPQMKFTVLVYAGEPANRLY
jgi:hypothetical protein